MKKNVLKVESPDNPDWNGSWSKDEVEKEMRELGIEPANEKDWLYWVVGHVFDCPDFDGSTEKFVCECDRMARLVLVLSDGTAAIEKL